MLVGLWAAMALPIQAPATTEPAARPLYDAVFAPLKRSEAQYAWLGPVGPYYPIRAADARQGGGAVLECLVQENGRLAKCSVSGEKPSGVGFGDAAMKMAQVGRIGVGPDAPVGQVVWVRVLFDPKMKAEVEGRPKPKPKP